MVKNSITKSIELSVDIRRWLEIQFKKPVTTDKILKQMKQNFKWTADFPLEELESYRLTIVPDYKSLLPTNPLDEKIEQKVALEVELQTVTESVDTDEDEFSKDEKKKLNMLKAHKKILAELWTNYNAIRQYDDEQNKVKYLEAMAKELQVITQFEASERDFLSAMTEVRKAEEKMSIQQHLDAIMSWWIPRMAEKGKTKQEILDSLFKIQLMLNHYSYLIMTEVDTEHANRELLENMYGQKGVKRIEN